MRLKFKAMQGIKSIQLVASGLRSITLPTLTRPPVKPDEAPTEALVKWGAKFYAYSVIAHVRNILESIAQLAKSADNVPALNVLGRNVFEWAAHACYISRNLKNYMRREWGRAWKLLSVNRDWELVGKTARRQIRTTRHAGSCRSPRPADSFKCGRSIRAVSGQGIWLQ